MQPAFGIPQSARLSALHRSDVRTIMFGMRSSVKSKNELRELRKSNQGTGNEEVRACGSSADFVDASHAKAKLFRVKRVCPGMGEVCLFATSRRHVARLSKMPVSRNRLQCCHHQSSDTSA